MRQLSDPKAEVRDVAASTLSGLVRGMSGQEAADLRSRFLASAAQLWGGRQRRGDGQAVEGGLQAQHGCLQGLRSFLLSSPYDCPDWTPAVLLALVRAADSRAAEVRAAASRAVSEFKRTHEQDSLQRLRDIMEPDQWDSVQQLTSQASYFV